MRNKNGAVIFLIIFYVLSLILIAAFVIDAFVIQIYYSDEGSIFLLLGIVFLVSAFAMTVAYLRLKKQERAVREHQIANYQNRINEESEFDEAEFNQWLTMFEPFARFGAKLEKTTDKTFSRFGGLPVVPTSFDWPTYNNRPIPFLLQLDFSEINADNKLQDFPTEGLMYVFVDSDKVNYIDAPQDDDYTYREGETFKILFFDKTDCLKVAAKPDFLGTVYSGFNVTAKTVKTYPDTDDNDEVFDIYCDRPVGGMDDAYTELCGKNMDTTLLGGCASYIQGGNFIIDMSRDNEEWVLLMQIASDSDDDAFVWGDSGMLYFYIRKVDLLACNFDNVWLEMQCY